MMDSPKLTARQQQILDLIQSAIARTGAPPTRAEIAAELGFKSANAAEEHLQALARKGVIELVSGTSRTQQLTDATETPTRRAISFIDRPSARKALARLRSACLVAAIDNRIARWPDEAGGRARTGATTLEGSHASATSRPRTTSVAPWIRTRGRGTRRRSSSSRS